MTNRAQSTDSRVTELAIAIATCSGSMTNASRTAPARGPLSAVHMASVAMP